MEGVIAVFALFGVPGIYFLGKTDIGQAIVYRLRNGDVPQDANLVSEVEELRHRLAEMEERLDFAERALAAGPDPRHIKHQASA
jgi:hypothetical protein